MDNFILLPIGKPALTGDLYLYTPTGELRVAQAFDSKSQGEYEQTQHLYQLSDQHWSNIGVGDYYIDTHGDGSKHIHYCGRLGDMDLVGWCDSQKILQTTDLDMGLPLIPKEVVQEYIQHYNQVPA